jgi:hypothetical protein
MWCVLMLEDYEQAWGYESLYRLSLLRACGPY